jgi:hypothetical protein
LERIVANHELGLLLFNYRIAQKCSLDRSLHHQTIHVFGAHLPTANGRVDEGNRLFTTVDCGLSMSTRWITSIIADFVFPSLWC